MNFWQNVDAELVYLGKTRKELANAIGFDAANISFGIKRNSIPAADTALKVSRFLGVSLDSLLEMTDIDLTSSSTLQLKEIQNKLRRFSKEDLDAVQSVINAIDEKY